MDLCFQSSDADVLRWFLPVYMENLATDSHQPHRPFRVSVWTPSVNLGSERWAHQPQDVT